MTGVNDIVNLMQMSCLTLCLFGILLLVKFRPYQQICVLLGLVATASLFNLLEEVGGSKDIYLVTPIFVIGFGPAIYLAIKQLLGEKVTLNSYWHFTPMLIALPFTHFPDSVIAVGTCWRLLYAVLTLRKLYQFRALVFNLRSDAGELSVRWLVWSVCIMSIVNMLDLVRLNLQVELGYFYNLLGQGISTAVALGFFTLLIYKLVHHSDAICSLSKDSVFENIETSNQAQRTCSSMAIESAEQYQQIYEQLAQEIENKSWYKIPRITLQQLSELSGFQSRDISRAINLVAENNFNDFINKYRLDHITQRLKQNPNQSMLSLATDAGFNAKSTFNAAFKRIYKMTPVEYKKQMTGSRF